MELCEISFINLIDLLEIMKSDALICAFPGHYYANPSSHIAQYWTWKKLAEYIIPSSWVCSLEELPFWAAAIIKYATLG